MRSLGGLHHNSVHYPWVVSAFILLHLLFLALFDPFAADGVEILDNRDFARGFNGWKAEGSIGSVSADGGALSIDHSDKSSSTTLSQCWPAQSLPEKMLLSAEAMSRSLVHGKASWHEGRIDLVGYDSLGTGNYRVKTRLLSMHGDRDWFDATGLFSRVDSAETYCVEVSLYDASGLFRVRQLSLQGAEPLLPFKLGKGMLMLGWAVLALWLGGAVYRHYRGRPQGLWLLLLLPLLLGGILMPNELRLQMEQQILEWLSLVGFESTAVGLLREEQVWRLWPAVWDLAKVSHLVGFMLLGAILLSPRGEPVYRILVALLLLALATELLQSFVPQRVPRLSDFIVDAVGIALGWIAVSFSRWLFQGPGSN